MSVLTGLISKLSPYTLAIKIGLVVVALGYVGWLRHDVSSLKAEVAAQKQEIELAKQANDSNLGTINSLKAANQEWAAQHEKDLGLAAALDSQITDLNASYLSKLDALKKLQKKDKDKNGTLSLSLDACCVDLANRLRAESQALH